MSIQGKSHEELAYEIWEARGRPHGSSEQDWLEAERKMAKTSSQLKVEEASLESFPASDPPASHAPDVPPSNAGAKWAAARNAASTRKPI